MAPEISLSTHTFWNKSKENPEIVRDISSVVDNIEIFSEHTGNINLLYDEEKIKEIIDVVKEKDIRPTVHAPYHDLNIASLNDKIRKSSVEAVKKSIDLSRELGASVLTVHPGFYYNFAKMEGMKKLIESLKQIKSYTGEELKICVENMAPSPKKLCTNPKEIRYLLNNVDVKLTLDLAHLYLAKKSKVILKEFKNEVEHLHVSRIDENQHHHPLKKEDMFEYERYLNILDYDKTIVIEGLHESKTSLRRSVELVRKYLIEGSPVLDKVLKNF